MPKKEFRKADKDCTHYGKYGHMKENCFKLSSHYSHSGHNNNVKENYFKLNGYPEWYKEFKDKKGSRWPIM